MSYRKNVSLQDLTLPFCTRPDPAFLYNDAKQYISANAKGTFTDESGVKQTLFVAKGNDFNNSSVYSQYRNNSAYRDYYWTVMGDNLLPDHPTSQELAIYNQRETLRQSSALKNALPGLTMGALTFAVGNISAKSGTAIDTKIGANSTTTEINQARINNNFSRDDNLTTGLVPAETINKQFTDQGYTAPFTAGTNVNVSVAGSGTPANMVVTQGQAAAIANGKPALGGFSTPDLVPNQGYVRSNLAITADMKPDVSMVQPVQTTGKPMVIVEGKIAPQAPVSQYPGNGNQNFYDYPVGGSRTDYVQPVGPAQPLPTVTPPTTTH